MNPPREKKTYGIVGTAAVGNMHAVTSKLVSVFATKLAPVGGNALELTR